MPSPTEPPPRRSALPAIAVVLVLAAGGAASWFLMRPAPNGPAPLPPPVRAPPPHPPDPPLPRAAQTDVRLAELLGPLSLFPAWAQWLKQPDLLDRWVVILDNLVEDETPRRQLAFLAAGEPFRVRAEGGKLFVDPQTYSRYDTVGAVVGSLDAGQLAGVWRLLQPLLSVAWRASGHPGGDIRAAAQKALQRLVGAPVAEGPIELRKAGVVYMFADAKLEKQGAVEKHLLRMGPKNTQLLQAKARELQGALGLVAPR